jgi:hypothetical protein
MLLLQALLLLPMAAATRPPFHSIATASGWVCKDGFFRTLPLDPALATCRRCNNLTEADCAQDTERFIPCSATANARCAPCLGSPPINMAFTNHCASVRCTPGYYYYNQSNCQPCPKGSVCDGEAASPCGPLLTTLAPGATSPLQCMPLPDAPQEQQLFLIDLLLSVQTEGLTGGCATLFQAVLTWLTYGALLDCQLGLANYSTGIAGLQCVVLSSRQYAPLYIQWLGPRLQSQREWIQSFLQVCLDRPGLTLAELSATISTVTAVAPATPLPNASSYVKPPLLSYDARRWGTAPADIVAALVGFVLLAAALCLSGCMAAAVGCILLLSGRKWKRPGCLPKWG